jgi:class 3 adenylate cyclase
MGKDRKPSSQSILFKIELPSPPQGCPDVCNIYKETVTVGRSEENDIIMRNSSISRKHMRLTYIDCVLHVEDLKSKNGTFFRIGKKWKKIKGKITATLPVSLKVGTIVFLVDIYKPASSHDKKKEFFNSMIPMNGKEITEQEKIQAIMVLDLCESSKLANTDEKMAFHLKRRLESISKRILDKAEVDFYKNTGDGFIATFNNVTNAFNAATSLLEVLKMRNQRTPNPDINVRIALHFGKTHIYGDMIKDIYGTDVDITFRLEHVNAVAFPSLKTVLPEHNRILCSKHFVHELSARGLNVNTFIFCGIAKLKGIKNPPEVYLVPSPS